MLKKALLIGISSLALASGALAYAKTNAFLQDSDALHQLELFGDVLTIVQQQYVVKVDDKKLIEAALDGMLSSLDPHSNYLNPTEFKELREMSEGAYGGLGLEVTSEDGAVKVITPMDDTPAARAGVQAGDFITSIDGQSVLGESLTDAVKSMKGAPGTSVTLTLVRNGKDPFDVKLTREIINVKSVKSRMEGDYGYLRVTNFNENTGREAKTALQGLLHDHPNMKGLVLDLRNNPGGIVDQSVDVASDFLTGGEVVTQRGRDARDIERYNAKGQDMLHGMPMAVLINPGSASAAEIVAGALQDRHRAVLVGVTSFGKGSVQTVMPLRGGADGALKLTTARYYTPSGRSIQKTGIDPDLEVAQSKEQADALANDKLQFSEASFKNSLNADEGKVRRTAHQISEYPPVGFDVKKGDYQLQRALDVLGVGGDLTRLKRGPTTTVASEESRFAPKGKDQQPSPQKR
jgi:carboxyl-terminal processing protease